VLSYDGVTKKAGTSSHFVQSVVYDGGIKKMYTDVRLTGDELLTDIYIYIYI
jgi:hypothetical protein